MALPALKALDRARQLTRGGPAEALYLARIEELETEMLLLSSLGDAKAVRPLALRLYGRGDLPVMVGSSTMRLREVADRLLADVPDEAEEATLPAEAAPDEPSLAASMGAAAQHARLEIQLKVDERLVSDAAAGERTVYLASRTFGERQAARLAVHEVLGHLLAGANGRSQPLGLYVLGTSGSFADQEGVAIYLEEAAGVLDGRRLRTLAGRVLATDSVHDGATFYETARLLTREHGFSAQDATVMGLRAHRAGGVARDAVYLWGWLRVRGAIERGEASSLELRNGKVSLDSLPHLRELAHDGLWRPPSFRSDDSYCPGRRSPKRSSSLRATAAGTSLETSPPSRLASLTRFDAT